MTELTRPFNKTPSAINLWRKYTEYVVQIYRDSLEDANGLPVVDLDKVRSVFKEANQEAGYCLPQVLILFTLFLMKTNSRGIAYIRATLYGMHTGILSWNFCRFANN